MRLFRRWSEIWVPSTAWRTERVSAGCARVGVNAELRRKHVAVASITGSAHPKADRNSPKSGAYVAGEIVQRNFDFCTLDADADADGAALCFSYFPSARQR